MSERPHCPTCRWPMEEVNMSSYRCANELCGAEPAAPEAPAPAPLEMERVAIEVHAAWRDGMLNQGRPVAKNRLRWETLHRLDHELDHYIADRVWKLIASQGETSRLTAELEQVKAERDRMREFVMRFCDFYPDCAQLLDGWHQDGTAWSEWDESVRQHLTQLGKAAEAALGEKGSKE